MAGARRDQAEPTSFSRAQYRQALSRRNAGVAEDSSRKNRKFCATEPSNSEAVGHDIVERREVSFPGETKALDRGHKPRRLRYICERFLTGKRKCRPRNCVHFMRSHSKRMAGATGLEPATFGVTGRHSNQLSYAPASSPQQGTREGGRCRAAYPIKSSQVRSPVMGRPAIRDPAKARGHWASWDGRGD